MGFRAEPEGGVFLLWGRSDFEGPSLLGTEEENGRESMPTQTHIAGRGAIGIATTRRLP